LEERLEATPLSPEQLQGRASELRAEAEQAQTGGDKDAKVALADHYEETAASSSPAADAHKLRSSSHRSSRAISF